MKCRECDKPLTVDEEMYNEKICDSCEMFERHEQEELQHDFILLIGGLLTMLIILLIIVANLEWN